MSFTYNYPMPSITGDVIVWDRRADKILLIKRGGEPYKDCWAIVGGFFDINRDASVQDGAIRELKEEVNIDLTANGKFTVQRWSQYQMATGQMNYDKGHDKDFDTLVQAEAYVAKADSGFGGDTRYRYTIVKPLNKFSLSFLTIQDAIGRDPRGRVVTAVYVLTIWDGIESLDIKAQDDAAEYKWFPAADLVAGKIPLAFDHLDSIRKFKNNTTYV